jgi:hypothetical protein
MSTARRLRDNSKQKHRSNSTPHGRELQLRDLQAQLLILIAAGSALASHLSTADTNKLDFKQWGLLAI